MSEQQAQSLDGAQCAAQTLTSYPGSFPLTAQERAWVWGYSNTWTQSSQSVAGERSSTGDMCCWDCWSVSGYKLQERHLAAAEKSWKQNMCIHTIQDI